MKIFGAAWVWRMALRDGRRGIDHLWFSVTCVALAVASVVVAYSFRDNVQSSVRLQAKSLLGADLALESREEFSTDAESLIRSIGGDQSRQIGFTSMVYFPASGDSRLVQVRAIGGQFPYYGALESEPIFSLADFHGGPNALVDDNVLLQFNAQVGERIKIGDYEFRIAGRLRKIPGETLAFSLISPRIYIPMAYLDRTQLVQKGSLVRYRVFFKLDARIDADRLVAELGPRLQTLRLEADTVSRRSASIADSMEILSRYLRLAVFIAALLASVGVASVVHVYAKEKAPAVALLKCIGAPPGAAVAVYLLQVVSVTALSALLGALLGVAAQFALPYALKDFLPVKTAVTLSPSGIVAGFAVGLGCALAFAALPLLPLRQISPLLALRASYQSGRPVRDPRARLIVVLIVVLILAGVTAFAIATTGSVLNGLWFSAGVMVVFGALLLLARGAIALLRRHAPAALSFVWRQGLANLYRPNNQTTAVILALGLGTFLLVTLQGVQSLLVNQVAERGAEGDANLVLFDVQRDQRAGVSELLRPFKLSRVAEVPIVTMRLASVKGRSVEALRADRDTTNIPEWALRREYRSTYRSELTGTEQIVAGAWLGKVAADSDPVPVSVEKGIAETLRIGLGDALQFEIQGVILNVRVGSIRTVDWQRVQPNFFVVFPAGVLESAPQFFALVARAESNRAAAELQRAVVGRFPNVSIIDLSLILDTLNGILGRVSFAMRFIAMFTILTGLAVLTSAVLGSRAQRLRESVLLRTLGAARGQIMGVIAAEYLLLGAVANSAGAALGCAAAWGLGYFFFRTAVTLALWPVAVIFLATTAATVLAGVLGAWGIFDNSPAEALRAEA